MQNLEGQSNAAFKLWCTSGNLCPKAAMYKNSSLYPCKNNINPISDDDLLSAC